MSAVREHLKKVRALLADPASWTQGWPARDEDGCRCSATSGMATSWCITGAIDRVCPNFNDYFDVSEAFRQANGIRADLDGGIVKWNDARSRSHANVLAALDKAIADTSDA